MKVPVRVFLWGSLKGIYKGISKGFLYGYDKGSRRAVL